MEELRIYGTESLVRTVDGVEELRICGTGFCDLTLGESRRVADVWHRKLWCEQWRERKRCGYVAQKALVRILNRLEELRMCGTGCCSSNVGESRRVEDVWCKKLWCDRSRDGEPTVRVLW